MTTIRDLQQNLKSFNPLYESIKAAQANTKEMILLNLGQLFIGENNQGNSFKKYRWEDYAQQKNQQNPRPGLGYPDLKLTGGFYKGFFATVTSNGIVMGSHGKHAQWLEEYYSRRGQQLIYGLHEENMKQWIEDCFMVDYAKAVDDHTGLKLSTPTSQP
ncbi:MAG: hypothetical protein WCI57_04185 [Candidatus Berkelbacteria bacterium]